MKIFKMTLITILILCGSFKTAMAFFSSTSFNRQGQNTQFINPGHTANLERARKLAQEQRVRKLAQERRDAEIARKLQEQFNQEHVTTITNQPSSETQHDAEMKKLEQEKLEQERQDAEFARKLQEQLDPGLVATINGTFTPEKPTQNNDDDAEFARKLQEQYNQEHVTTVTKQSTSQTQNNGKNAFEKDCYPLPVSLQGKRIYHLRVNAQQGATCGYHTLTNAKIIETLIISSREITSSKIIAKNEEIVQRCGIRSNLPLMVDNDIVPWMKTLQLQDGSIYILSQADGITTPLAATNTNKVPLFDKKLQELRTSQKPMVINIACHTGTHNCGHWTYVGIIKEKNKQPYLIYLNSGSATLAQSPKMVALIEHIYTFIA